MNTNSYILQTVRQLQAVNPGLGSEALRVKQFQDRFPATLIERAARGDLPSQLQIEEACGIAVSGWLRANAYSKPRK